METGREGTQRISKDLQKAEKDFEEGDYKWSVVSAYYSMFHMTKAVMFEERYREKGHLAILIFLDYLIMKGELRENTRTTKNMRRILGKVRITAMFTQGGGLKRFSNTPKNTTRNLRSLPSRKRIHEKKLIGYYHKKSVQYIQ